MAKKTEIPAIPNNDEIIAIVDKAFAKYKGEVYEFESAIGALVTARLLGWKPLLLMHTQRTYKKYESILGIEFKDYFPEEGQFADRSRAWKGFKKVTGFWKAVRGGYDGLRTGVIDPK